MKDRDLLRIGAANYLGARPLVFGLDERPEVRLVQATPSRTAELLEADELDAGLIPSIDYFRLTVEAKERQRHRPLAIIAGIAVGSDGPAGSVRLFCRRDWPFMRHVAVDPDSRTCSCLVRLLLKRLYGCKPHYRLPRPHPEGLDQESDALLLIGDRGLTYQEPGCRAVVDLGEIWGRYARKPFVYAVWVARETEKLGRLTAVLSEAKKGGLAARDEIACRGAEALAIPVEQARTFLYENMRYDLGPAELVGLETFYRWAAQEELAPQSVPIRLAGREEEDPGGERSQ